jgi:uncharacterized membrane protein (GlpM family)
VARASHSLATLRGVESLILKLVVTPALIGAASLAGRRWGAAVGGWLVGIPFTSAPIALFLAVDHGASFAASASVGMLLGTISQAIFCLAYSFSASRGVPWLASFGFGCVGFAASTVVLNLLSVPLISASLATLVALVVVLLLVPHTPDEPDKSESPATLPPRWDIPARMVVATVFVVLLTSVAPVLGPYLSGLLSPFPLFGAILVVFVHRSERATSAMKLLRGLLFGLFAPAGFFMALSALIEPLGIGLGFAAATATALVAQGITLRLLRPETLSG